MSQTLPRAARSCFVVQIANNFPSPITAAPDRVTHTYTGDMTSAAGQAMLACDAKGPLMIQITKLYSRCASRFLRLRLTWSAEGLTALPSMPLGV